MGNRLLALLAAVCLAVIPCAMTPSAIAAPSDYVQINWDGTTTNLDWVGGQYATSSDSFVGTPVVSPGDFETRTATVKNAGPSAATALVELIDVAVVTPPEAVNTDLQDCVHIFIETNGKTYDATWRQAVGDRVGETSWSTSLQVPMEATFSITAGAYFPVEETRGKSEGHPSQELSFAVRVTMSGDTAETPPAAVRTGGHVAHSHTSYVFPLVISLLAVPLIACVTKRRNGHSGF